jgi:hypothetical protein
LVETAFIYLNPSEFASFRMALAIETDDDVWRLELRSDREVAQLQKTALERLQRSEATNLLLRAVFETLHLDPAALQIVTTDCKRHGHAALLAMQVASMCAGCPCPIRVNRKRELATYCSNACRQAAYRHRQKEERPLIDEAP